MSELTVLSLGWGVQSFTLAAMVALGELPPIDYAIHADTGWERSETYTFAERWTPWLEERGIKIITVQVPSSIRDMSDSSVTPSLFTVGPLGRGMLRRTCTDRWKIRPMRTWLRGELSRRGIMQSRGVVKKWIGITLDEANRMPISSVRYIVIHRPFLEMLPQMYTRQMCINWLQDHDLEVPVKSACIICPYHNFWTWREIQLADNGDWQRAIDADRAIRDKRPNYKCYLCSDRKPLEDHDFNCMTLW